MDLLGSISLFLAVGLVTAGLRWWAEVQLYGRLVQRPSDPEVFKNLARRDQSEFVRRARNPSVQEIIEAVDTGAPTVPDDRELLTRVRVRQDLWQRRH